MTKALVRTAVVIVGLWCAMATSTALPATEPATQPRPTTRPTAQSATRAATRPSQPAKELTLDLGNKVTMKLVLIPAGKFTMGSPMGEKDRQDDEWAHDVTISKPFYMGVFEVTQEQYEAVTGKNPSQFKGAQNPVEQVEFQEALLFCKSMARSTGKAVSLPTEAQWEYACRAGGASRFQYGDDDAAAELSDHCWYAENSGSKTHPVGQRKPNAWGLYDVHGNVWEWCSDQFGSYGLEAATDPAGPVGAGRTRVIRGGGWGDAPRYCRSAARGGMRTVLGRSDVGFRVVVESE